MKFYVLYVKVGTTGFWEPVAFAKEYAVLSPKIRDLPEERFWVVKEMDFTDGKITTAGGGEYDGTADGAMIRAHMEVRDASASR